MGLEATKIKLNNAVCLEIQWSVQICKKFGIKMQENRVMIPCAEQSSWRLTVRYGRWKDSLLMGIAPLDDKEGSCILLLV